MLVPKFQLLTLLITIPVLGLAFQSSSKSKIPKEVLKATQNIKLIEGGTFFMGQSEQQFIKRTTKDSMLLSLNETRRVTVSSFYLSSTEVSNAEWTEFYNAKVAELGKEKAAIYYPDTTVWVKDFAYSYNEPMVNYYFQHPSYKDYPVVGVSWQMAQEYCRWKSNVVNKQLKEAGLDPLPDFRLPTEAEWEAAALLGHYDKIKDEASTMFYPWVGNHLKDKNGVYLANFGNIIDQNGVSLKSYADDFTIYTASVKSYAPNFFGLYNMAGNVSEWVQDVARPITVLGSGDFENPFDHPFDINKPAPKPPTINFANMKAEDIDSSYIVQLVLEHFGHPDCRVRKDTSLYSQDRPYIDNVIKALWSDIKIIVINCNQQGRIVKGGSWADPPIYLQSAQRQAFPENKTSSMIGFRVAMIKIGSLDADDDSIQDRVLKQPKTKK